MSKSSRLPLPVDDTPKDGMGFLETALRELLKAALVPNRPNRPKRTTSDPPTSVPPPTAKIGSSADDARVLANATSSPRSSIASMDFVRDALVDILEFPVALLRDFAATGGRPAIKMRIPMDDYGRCHVSVVLADDPFALFDCRDDALAEHAAEAAADFLIVTNGYHWVLLPVTGGRTVEAPLARMDMSQLLCGRGIQDGDAPGSFLYASVKKAGQAAAHARMHFYILMAVIFILVIGGMLRR